MDALRVVYLPPSFRRSLAAPPKTGWRGSFETGIGLSGFCKLHQTDEISYLFSRAWASTERKDGSMEQHIRNSRHGVSTSQKPRLEMSGNSSANPPEEDEQRLDFVPEEHRRRMIILANGLVNICSRNNQATLVRIIESLRLNTTMSPAEVRTMIFRETSRADDLSVEEVRGSLARVMNFSIRQGFMSLHTNESQERPAEK